VKVSTPMRLCISMVLILLAIAAAAAIPPQYPEKPITLLVGYGPGSGGDLIARSFADAASKHLRFSIVVVNRAGAGGTIAISEAIAAKPDGYTLGLGTAGTLTLQPHETRTAYAGPDTYAPVAKLVTQPHVLMVRTAARWKTVQEFINDARAHPGHLTIGVPGAGTAEHINVEQLKQLAKIDVNVAFFDGPKQVDAALTGQIDASLATPAPTMSHLKAGRGRALAVVAEHRMAAAPNVPTLKELGFNVTIGTFQAIIAPPNMPPTVIRALEEAIRKIVAEPSFISTAEATQSTIDYKGSVAFAAELRKAFEENGKLIEKLGMRKK
jgi:tripartite-type tricarboxylate transporter receptor subunit TctC